MKQLRIFAALLAAALSISALTACGGEVLTPIGESSSAGDSSASGQDSSSQPESSAAASEPSSEEDASNTADRAADAADALLGEPVPESAAADESYFDDAIFIGDSLTDGLAAYELLPREQVLADTGINPQTILTRECIGEEGSEQTVVEAAAALDPAKIYIMLGSNGVAFLNFDDIIGWYGELIDALQADHPDAEIYVQSILPVTADKHLEQELLTNERITELNGMIAEMAAEKGCFYLNVSEAVADENGCLPDELSADGMHFGVSTYRVWLDYLLTHTVEGALE
ncbi:MAG TPA: hypothetical protein IAB55_00220 [Candidatus Merdivicinus faecavium]|nr:hypothetical protein [Candidatus Merdivicinus faecavium]